MNSSRDGSRKPYRIAGIYDTETTNIRDDITGEVKAFPVLYIYNDVSAIDIEYYRIGDDDISFYRNEFDFLNRIEQTVADGQAHGYIPIVCAYNLMFDLQSIIYNLNLVYDMEACAQSSTSVYYLDLLDADGVTVLRFWDTFYLEQRGLAAMGETCGLPKLLGDWNYSLIRTPETPLSDDELSYAARDVQVIPAYLAWLLQANPHAAPEDLGVSMLTKTSIVRLYAKRVIGNLRYRNRRGKPVTLARAFELTCRQELPLDYSSYGIRKGCFRGGFTFTAANTAGTVVHNVASLDVTSMHHAFINGRLLPVHFEKATEMVVQSYVNHVLNTDIATVFEHYEKPFFCAFHACVTFTNIRLKEGSAFERYGIALIPQAKFGRMPDFDTDDLRNLFADKAARRAFHDSAVNPVFAFSKLYSADSATLYVNELELYAISRVYDFDSASAEYGEIADSFVIPPDYVTLQSNIFYKQKNACKEILKHYTEGERFDREIDNTIPEAIATGLKRGTIPRAFMESYYQSTVKGMFNAIYGTQAQDLFRPDYIVENGNINIDRDTIVDGMTFSDKKDELEKPRVCYNYGMRIVGGSRLHLVLAIELLFDVFGDSIDILAGDTDSLKIRCDDGITGADLLAALQPLHESVTGAIIRTQRRIRENFPDYVADLRGVGCFECENEGAFYTDHMELWNKARVSVSDGRAHVTCAGLSRPYGSYTIEDFINDLAAKHGFGETVKLALGYNVFMHNDICHALTHSRYDAGGRYRGRVRDHTGRVRNVDAPLSIALYPVGRFLGETYKYDNANTVRYLNERGIYPDTRPRSLELRDGKPCIIIECESGFEYIE